MPDRYFITLGAATTAGGKVVSSSRFETIDGVPLAVEGDLCWCPACLSEGVIQPDGPRMDATIDGRLVALHDDLCVCRCSPPPRLVAAQNVIGQSVDAEWFAERVAAATQRAAAADAAADAAALPAARGEHLPLALVDAGTQQPLAGLPYRLVLPTRVIEGTLDENGWSESLSAAEREAVRSGHVYVHPPAHCPPPPHAAASSMQAPPVPATPDPWFPRHPYHGTAVGGNVEPVAACMLLHRVGPAATLERAVAVPVLTPHHLWRSFQAEAEAIVGVDGGIDANPLECSRRINAAYARLWLADRRFQWAGLVAFASKGVGCGLLHAAAVSDKNRRVRDLIQQACAPHSGTSAAALPQSAMEDATHYLLGKLACAHADLFLDIYPLHRFFMERGWDEFNACLDQRQDAQPCKDILRSFECIEMGDIRESVDGLVRHEQLTILQAILYDDPVLRQLLATNQYAWASGFPTGDCDEITLTLSAECRAGRSGAARFARNETTALWVAEQRMRLASSAASRFHALLHGPERPYVEASMRAIAAA